MLQVIVYLALQFLLVFLLVDAKHAAGGEKTLSTTVLTSLLVILVLLCFPFFGWKAGLCAIAIWFVGERLFAPTESVHSPLALENETIEALVPQEDLVDRPEENPVELEQPAPMVQQEMEQDDEQLKLLYRTSGVAQFLRQEGIGFGEYKELFYYLADCDLSDLTAQILSDPESIRSLVSLKRHNVSKPEVEQHFRLRKQYAHG